MENTPTPTGSDANRGASEIEAQPNTPADNQFRDVGASEVEAHPARRPPMSEEQRLEEGLEETFPASDPVSAKHID